MPPLTWHFHSFHCLTPSQLYAILAARSAVFVVEQNCPYQDIDGVDAQSRHLTAWSAERVVAYLRIVPAGVKFPEPSIGRVLTALDYRRTGLGRELMLRGIRHLDEMYPNCVSRIGAQAHLQRFYSEFGFVTDSDIYLEDGIEHVEMVRNRLTVDG